MQYLRRLIKAMLKKMYLLNGMMYKV